MSNVKLLRHWHLSTSTEVKEGDWVQISDITTQLVNENNCSYIIKKIDSERLEVVVRPNLRDNDATIAINRNNLTKNYSFFREI